MKDMKLFNYYSLDECIDKKLVIKKMRSLKAEGKIEYDIDGDILHIDDIDLEDIDIKELSEFFYDNDVFPYLEKDDVDDQDVDDYNDWDENYEY
jgi:hypothetical protein